MGIVEVTKEEISENLDKRRFEITNLRRVLLNYVGKSLESTVTRMAIPLLYANWEGYVKEVCQLYMEYIERSGTKNRELKAEMLGYLWSSSIRPLTGGINFKKKKCERNINTKSNLNFGILENISAYLCFDVSFLIPYRHRLNALVNLRNNIAHGSFPSTMDYDIFDEYAKSILELMENFENIIIHNLANRNFCS